MNYVPQFPYQTGRDMTIRKKLDRCNDINDFIVQNKDRHI